MTISELRNISCCFTGHRSINPEHLNSINQVIESKMLELHSQGYINFLVGGALGFDTIAAQSVIKLRSQYTNIRLISVIPCKDQYKYWNQSDILTYKHNLDCSDKVIYISDSYTSDCMHRRNRFMVDYTSYCICYLTKSKGGAFYTTNYARNKGLQIYNCVDYFI